MAKKPYNEVDELREMLAESTREKNVLAAENKWLRQDRENGIRLGNALRLLLGPAVPME